MALTKEKVEKNATKYNKTAEKYGFINEALLKLLGLDFFTAPATSATKSFNAFEGGLVAHILNITKYAVKINEMLPEDKRVNTDSLIKVSCLHQIGKNVMFEPNQSSWHRERGIMYGWNEAELDLTVPERSLRYATKAEIELTDDEHYAICKYNNDFSNKPMNRDAYKLAAILRIANLIAVIEDK